ncbi:MAG: hypothetical protein AAF357_19760, partial [Verrucomicrobiota bacterium]
PGKVHVSVGTSSNSPLTGLRELCDKVGDVEVLLAPLVLQRRLRVEASQEKVDVAVQPVPVPIDHGEEGVVLRLAFL